MQAHAPDYLTHSRSKQRSIGLSSDYKMSCFLPSSIEPHLSLKPTELCVANGTRYPLTVLPFVVVFFLSGMKKIKRGGGTEASRASQTSHS